MKQKLVLYSCVLILFLFSGFVLYQQNRYDEAMTNQLGSELSPYLLQHKDNPVAWQPWSDEAFKKAKELDKPIFLSIGYATCHWCHVMEHESFEDPEVAKLMNETFINIKVDREERPDIDHLYMTVCQILTGSGGWPLTIIMTPDKRPFFAATYLPKQSLPNRPGMLKLIPAIDDAWKNQRDNILVSTQKIMAGLVNHNQLQSPESLSPTLSETALSQFESSFDTVYGGFGKAPKFPIPHHILFLLRHFQRTKNEQALFMAKATLDAMRHGGIYDHIGFGFHRYSTDDSWHTPHFEKMLYDQALMLLALSLMFEVTNDSHYEQTIDDVITYLVRDLNDNTGGFFSAEDADSDGEEGTFYVWSYDELSSLLTTAELNLISQLYQLDRNGNYDDEATQKPTGLNIFHKQALNEKTLAKLGLTIEEATNSSSLILTKLFKERSKRNRPSLDDKILTDWNGLLIAGLAQAGRVTKKTAYLNLAKECAQFIATTMTQKDGTLSHRYRDGSVGILATAFDYHYLIFGLINLYQATLDDTYLKQADLLLKKADQLFWNDSENTYLISQDDDLLIKQHDSYDGALPAVNSVAYFNLIQLATYLHKPTLYTQATRLSSQFGAAINAYPIGYSFWLQAHDYLLSGLPTLVTTHALTSEQENVLSAYPQVVVQVLSESPYLASLPETATFKPTQNKPTFYYCHDFKCEIPTTSFEDVITSLNRE